MVRVKTGRALLGRDRVEGSKDGRSSFTKTDSFALPVLVELTFGGREGSQTSNRNIW